MKTKILIATYVVLICLMIYLLFISIENKIIINKYKNEEYLETEAKLLTHVTFQKSYTANYNYGNILYQNGEYEKAIEEYEKALKTLVPSKKECKIRINCSLAMCKTVQVDESSQESITEAIETYQNAIKILTQKDCNNHNQDAKKLKKDIEKEIERLKKLQKNTNNKTEKEEKEENEQQQEEEEISEKIQDIKQEAINEQREKESTYKNFNKTYRKNGKNW